MTTTTTTPDPTPKKRTDWDEELRNACRAWEAANEGRRIVAQSMIFPANPGVYVRVDDALPRSFPDAKSATARVIAWTDAP